MLLNYFCNKLVGYNIHNQCYNLKHEGPGANKYLWALCCILKLVGTYKILINYYLFKKLTIVIDDDDIYD